MADKLLICISAELASVALARNGKLGRCRTFRNDGGRFRDVSRQAGIAAHAGKALGVLVEDFNGDGWPDLFVANDTEPNFLFLNERNGTFSERGMESGVAVGESGEPRAGMGIDAAEAGNDGRLSLAVTHFAGESLGFYRQDRSAVFTDQAGAARSSQSRGAIPLPSASSMRARDSSHPGPNSHPIHAE